jgi:hypothetical protein
VDLNFNLDKSDGEAETRRRVAGVKAHVKGATVGVKAHGTAAASSDALAAKGSPQLVPSVFRGLTASVACARSVFEAGHSSKDPINNRFGDCVGVLAHVGEGAAGWAQIVVRICGGGARACNVARSFVSCCTVHRPEVGKR